MSFNQKQFFVMLSKIDDFITTKLGLFLTPIILSLIMLLFLPAYFVPTVILSVALVFYRTLKISGSKLKTFFVSLMMMVLSILTIRIYIAEIRYIVNDGMKPTIPINTRVIVDRTSYMVMQPRRGDIVIFSMDIIGRNRATTVVGSGIDKLKISRIIAIPGDSVEIKDGVTFINGKPLLEPYINVQDNQTNYKLVNLQTCESVKKNTGFKSKRRTERVYTSCYYLFRGDNRTANIDGTNFGLVPEQSIRGKVRSKFWPTDQIDNI
jgi:signal peptidase I